MTPEEHRKRHVELHNALDELLADYITHNPKARLSTTSCIQLVTWSFRQTLIPTENPNQEQKAMGTLSLMNNEGDTKKTWDANNPAEVEDARRSFNDLKAKGYTAFRVTARDGSKGEEMREFDPAAESIIMAPRMAGG